jgi:DNA-directed RNA polymerase specialized sigma24 family protein
MNDADGFSELYESEGQDLLIFLTRRTLDGETALDLLAETFAIAMRHWAKLRELEREQQRAWLFTVARRQFGRYLRRARVERRATHKLGIQVPLVDHDDLLLRIVEERSYEDVAAQMGVSEQTARARVSRGLRKLAEALEPYQSALEGSS